MSPNTSDESWTRQYALQISLEFIIELVGFHFYKANYKETNSLHGCACLSLSHIIYFLIKYNENLICTGQIMLNGSTML